MTYQWPPLESNPEIFEPYMAGLGLSEAWGFSELFGFEEDLLGFVPQPVVAVIVNMERLKREEDIEKGSIDTQVDYYMKQTDPLDQACGLIACLHAIYNNHNSITLDHETPLGKYWNTVQDKTPEQRAMLLEGNTDFQEQHKAFAAKGQSVMAESPDDVVCHYVAFVLNSKGQSIELDGTKKGPVVVAEQCDDVLRGSIAEIQKRLANGEISESLSMMTLNAKET